MPLVPAGTGVRAHGPSSPNQRHQRKPSCRAQDGSSHQQGCATTWLAPTPKGKENNHFGKHSQADGQGRRPHELELIHWEEKLNK